MQGKHRLRGSILLLLCAMIWGFAFVAQDVAADSIPTFTCGFVRSFIAVAALVPVIALFDKFGKSGRSLFRRGGVPLTKREFIGGLLCGAVLAVATAFQQEGIAEAGAGKAAFITAFYVVLVPLAGSLFLRRHSSLRIWLSVLTCLLGVGLLTVKDNFTIGTGDLLVFCAAICFCGHILLIDHFSEGSDGIRLSAVQFFSCGVLNLLPALCFETIDFAAVGTVMGPMLFLGVLSSGGAYTLAILGQQDCGAASAAILMSTESLFGVLGGALFLSEVLTVQEYIGCAVVFAAVIASQLPARRKKKETARQVA